MALQKCLELRKVGLPEECLRICDEELAGGEHVDPKILVCKGWALGSLNRYQEAVEVLNVAHQLSTTHRQQANISILRQQYARCITFDEELRRRSAHHTSPSREWFASVVQQRMVSVPSGELLQDLSKTYVLDDWRDPGLEGYAIRDIWGPEFTEQTTDGYRYARNQNFCFFEKSDREPNEIRAAKWSYRQYPRLIGYFPVCDKIIHFPSTKQIMPDADVWVATNVVDSVCHHTLRTLLDIRRRARYDYVMPMYQNIIDPNLCVNRLAGDNQPHNFEWVPSEFEVTMSKLDIVVALQLYTQKSCFSKLPSPAVRNICQHLEGVRPVAKLVSPINDLDPKNDALLCQQIEQVFNAAIPLLAELRRPALLLPGPLQVVVKAQRVYLEGGEEYEGVWHYDGKYENIVAVALYYYRVSPELDGGDLELMDKRPREDWFWLGGDCDPSSLRTEDLQAYRDEVPHCKIPVGDGTLVVFSNYQFIHRVLRMVHNGTSERKGCRDFLAFFIVDQRCPLKTAREVTPEFDYAIRDTLLQDQLKPSGAFGIFEDDVYSTGNGSAAQLGWMRTMPTDLLGEWANRKLPSWSKEREDRSGQRQLQAFNLSPPVGRGLSWVFDASDEELCDPNSTWIEIRHHDGKDMSSPYYSEYWNSITQQKQANLPVEGVSQTAHEFAKFDYEDFSDEELGR